MALRVRFIDRLSLNSRFCWYRLKHPRTLCEVQLALVAQQFAQRRDWYYSGYPTSSIVGRLDDAFAHHSKVQNSFFLPLPDAHVCVDRLLARFEGIPKRTGLELSLMTRFFIFQVIVSDRELSRVSRS